MLAFGSSLIEKDRSWGFYEKIDYYGCCIVKLIEYFLCQFALQRALKGSYSLESNEYRPLNYYSFAYSLDNYEFILVYFNGLHVLLMVLVAVCYR